MYQLISNKLYEIDLDFCHLLKNQTYKYKEFVIQIFEKMESDEHFGRSQDYGLIEHINKISDHYPPRRLVNIRKCRYPNFRITLHKTR